MKKILKCSMLFLAFIFVFLFNVSVSADTGPKSYITVNIVGNTDNLYMTLLSETSSTGPHNVYNEKYSNEDTYHNEDEKNINLIFRNYKDTDNFYYLEYTYQSIKDKTYHWGYYPPTTFKVLIYNADGDFFITDNKIYQKEEFGSVYTLTLSDEKIEVAKTQSLDTPIDAFEITKENKGAGSVISSFFIRLTICLTIEILLALLFGFRKWELLPIAITNIITQVGLNVALAVDIYLNGFNMPSILACYIPAEIGILLIEFLAYFLIFKNFKFKRENPIHPVRILLYTITANVVSLFGGFIILTILQNAGFYA